MNVCEECGKGMATRGGLEIHMQLAHAAPEPVPAAVPMGVAEAVPPVVATRRVAASGSDWQLPAFLRGVDPTLPLTALLVVALLIAGVGSALHRSSAGAPTTASAPSASAAPDVPAAPVDVAADQKLAQSLVLTASDYPDGWVTTPRTMSPSDLQNDRLDAQCRGVPDPSAVQTADVAMEARQGNVMQASSEAIAFRTEQQAAADLASEGGPKAESCAKQGLTRVLSASGLTVADIGVGRFAASTGNVRSVALHTEIAVIQGQARGVMHADVVFLQHGRVEGQAVFLSFAGEFPADTEQTLVTRFAHRVAGA